MYVQIRNRFIFKNVILLYSRLSMPMYRNKINYYSLNFLNKRLCLTFTMIYVNKIFKQK